MTTFAHRDPGKDVVTVFIAARHSCELSRFPISSQDRIVIPPVLAVVIPHCSGGRVHTRKTKPGGTLHLPSVRRRRTTTATAAIPSPRCTSRHRSTSLLKFNLDEYPQVIGDLADSWTVAPDLMSYTFRLHRGVRSHDGQELAPRISRREL